MKTYSDGKTRSDWDTDHATYFWQIHLDKNHPANSGDITLTGFSKKRYQAEAQDKDYLLKRKISMLYKRGYFDRMKHLDIYCKAGEMIDKAKDPKILTLYPRTFNIHESLFYDRVYKNQSLWLSLFYTAIKKGESIDTIIPSTRNSVSQDFYLDPSKRDHLTYEHLVAYARRLEANGHPYGAIKDYMSKVRAIKNW